MKRVTILVPDKVADKLRGLSKRHYTWGQEGYEAFNIVCTCRPKGKPRRIEIEGVPYDISNKFVYRSGQW